MDADAKRDLHLMHKARRFPDNTCPASRHAALVAAAMLRGQADVVDVYELPHVGGSVAATVTALWEARSMLLSLGYHTHWTRHPPFPLPPHPAPHTERGP